MKPSKASTDLKSDYDYKETDRTQTLALTLGELKA